MTEITSTTPYDFCKCDECKNGKIEPDNICEVCDDCQAEAVEELLKVFTVRNIVDALKETDRGKKSVYCVDPDCHRVYDVEFCHGYRRDVLIKLLNDERFSYGQKLDIFNDDEIIEYTGANNKETFDKVIGELYSFFYDIKPTKC